MIYSLDEVNTYGSCLSSRLLKNVLFSDNDFSIAVIQNNVTLLEVFGKYTQTHKTHNVFQYAVTLA